MPSRRVPPPCCRAAPATIGTGRAGVTGTTGTVATGATVPAATAMKALAHPPPKETAHEHGQLPPFRWRQRRPNPAALLPPAQDLPLLERSRPEDRLQGREAPAALPLGARQDRAEPHHRGLGQEAASPGPGHQARPLPVPPP